MGFNEAQAEMPGKTGGLAGRRGGRQAGFNEAQAEMPGKTNKKPTSACQPPARFNEAQAEMPGKTGDAVGVVTKELAALQ